MVAPYTTLTPRTRGTRPKGDNSNDITRNAAGHATLTPPMVTSIATCDDFPALAPPRTASNANTHTKDTRTRNDGGKNSHIQAHTIKANVAKTTGGRKAYTKLDLEENQSGSADVGTTDDRTDLTSMNIQKHQINGSPEESKKPGPTFSISEARSTTDEVPATEEPEAEVEIRTLNHCRALLHALCHGYRIVGLDVETYMNRSRHVSEKNRDEHIDAQTELGITVSDLLSIPKLQRLDPVRRIRRLKARHIRVQEYAHLCNRYKPYYPVCKNGCEEHFQFGETEYATIFKTGLILQEMLCQPKNRSNPGQGYRPTIILLHDAKNDSKWLKRFGVNLFSNDFQHVTVVDTQGVARHQDYGNSLGLDAWCRDNNISTDHAHNSGNDAFRTTTCALIDCCEKIAAENANCNESPADSSSDCGYQSQSQPSYKGSGYVSQPTVTPADAVEEVRQCCWRHQSPNARFKGCKLFCHKCGQKGNHRRPACEENVQCTRCLSYVHMDKNCLKMHVHDCKANGNCLSGCKQVASVGGEGQDKEASSEELQRAGRSEEEMENSET